MGKSCVSVHFRTEEGKRVVEAARTVVKEAGGGVLIAPLSGGGGGAGSWISGYPSKELFDSGAVDGWIGLSGAPVVLVVQVYDSGVMMYWMYRNGECVDYYNSSPDYFGEGDEGDYEAMGSPKAFDGLVDAAGLKRLGSALKPRTLDGEAVGGRVPDREEDRLAEVGRVLGIAGILGLYEDIQDGRREPGVAPMSSMIEVGSDTTGGKGRERDGERGEGGPRGGRAGGGGTGGRAGRGGRDGNRGGGRR